MKHLPHILLVALLLLSASTAQADSPASLRDFAEVTANNQFVFVLLARADDHSNYNQVGRVDENPELRAKYQQSGLYRNDGSTDPLWTVDWNARRVDVSSDGHHLVRWGSWPSSGNYAEDALTFYRDGQEIKRYAVWNLVAFPFLLPHSISHYQWLDDASFDDAAGTVSLRTRHGEGYVFDVYTGTIISSYRSPWQIISVVVALGGLVVLGRWMWRRRRATRM